MIEALLPVTQVLILVFSVAGVGILPGWVQNREVSAPTYRSREQHGAVVLVQISDIHLSVKSTQKLQNLNLFVSGPLAAIGPDGVIITGDMVDAKRSMMQFESKGQIEQEWESYLSFLERLRTVLPTCTVVDLPGNHCRFNEALLSRSMFYMKRLQSSILGPAARQIEVPGRVHRDDGELLGRHKAVDIASRANRDAAAAASGRWARGRVRVVAVDATVNPAPNRHFFGHLSANDLARIRDLAKANSTLDRDELAASGFGLQFSTSSSATIVAAHFPANSIVVEGGMQALARTYDEGNAAMAISGHLHQLPYGDVPGLRHLGRRLHGVLGRGTLELEQPDFKTHGRYRVIIAKGPLVRFSEPRLRDYNAKEKEADESTDRWDPVVVFTSPATAEYVRPVDVVEGDASLSDSREWLLSGPRCAGCIEAVVWSQDAVKSVHAVASGHRAGRERLPVEVIGQRRDPDFMWTRVLLQLSADAMDTLCSDGSGAEDPWIRLDLTVAGGSDASSTHTESARFMCGDRSDAGNIRESGRGGAPRTFTVPGLPASYFATHSQREGLLAAGMVQTALLCLAVAWPLLNVCTRLKASRNVDEKQPGSILQQAIAWRIFIAVWLVWLWVGPWSAGASMFMGRPGVLTAWSHVGVMTEGMRKDAVSAEQEWNALMTGKRATTAPSFPASESQSSSHGEITAGIPTSLGGLLYHLPHFDGPIYIGMCLILCVTPLAQLFLLDEWQREGMRRAQQHSRARDSGSGHPATGSISADTATDDKIGGSVPAASANTGKDKVFEAIGGPASAPGRCGCDLLWGRPASLFGCGLLLGPVLGFMLLSLPLAVFQGIDFAIMCPVFTWANLLGLGWGVRVVVGDCQRRGQVAPKPLQQVDSGCPVDLSGHNGPMKTE